jgi:hypothetical protein
LKFNVERIRMSEDPVFDYENKYMIGRLSDFVMPKIVLFHIFKAQLDKNCP